ncbi:MAG: putative Ig domain-containing protein [Oscillospiraceae bacterium]|jgi:uncharacterized protein YkwD|nr:putative Ig domain-containing protein [Oscillospiraceae bacterium]
MMKRTLSILAVAVALAMLSGVFALPASAAVNTAGFAAEVVRLVNEERAKGGKGPLNFGNKALNDAAMQRAVEYATTPSLLHNRPGGRAWSTVFAEYGLVCYAYGENIAEGFTTPADVVAGWMGSDGHRKNIMGETATSALYNWIGVAVCEGAGGRLFWVQLFAGDSLADTGDTNPGGGIVTPTPVAPAITTASLPGGAVGTPYSVTLAATGDATITWTLDGGALPGGLSLSTAGVISGTPTASGAFTFTVKAANAAGSAAKTLSIAVSAAGGTATRYVGLFGMNTLHEDTPANWLMFFALFGWIWMWFI